MFERGGATPSRVRLRRGAPQSRLHTGMRTRRETFRARRRQDARPAAITLPLFLHRILRGRRVALGVTMRARTASACRLTEQGVEALS